MALKRVAIVFLALLLAFVLLGANVAMGLDRGALDAEYVTDELEAADAYATVVDQLLAELEEEVDEPPEELPAGVDPNRLLEDTLTEEFVREQFEGVVTSLYAYLHGETDELVIVIDFEPLADNLEDALAAQVAEMPLADLGLDEFPVPVEDETVIANPGALDEGAAAYEAELTRFEAEVKEAIQNQTPWEMSDEELDEAYDEYRDEYRDEFDEHVEDVVADEFPPALRPAVVALGETVGDAYMTDLDHGTFAAQLEDDKAALGAAVAAYALEEEDIIPPEQDLAEDLDDDALAPLVAAVGWIGTLALALPVVAVGLAGLMFVTVRDVVPVAKAAGVVALLVGIGGVALATVVPGVIDDRLLAEAAAELEEEALIELASTVIASLFDPILVQSVGLVATGAVLVGGGVAYGRHRGGSVAAPAGAGDAPAGGVAGDPVDPDGPADVGDDGAADASPDGPVDAGADPGDPLAADAAPDAPVDDDAGDGPDETVGDGVDEPPA